MARIRTIKPEFFRHEVLQDLEITHPQLRPMLVFAGLWGACDKNGVFEWKPRQLKLDILPFLENNMGDSLVLLREAGLIVLMIHGEKSYGYIPSFREHQRITGKEAQAPSKFPQPAEMKEWNGRGTNGETPEKQPGVQEGKGREREEEGKAAAVETTDEGGLKGEPAPKGSGEGGTEVGVVRQERMPMSEILDLKRRCLKTLMENPGQATVLQELCSRYTPEAIRDAFHAAAGAGVTNLNWVAARLKGRGRESPQGGRPVGPDAAAVDEQNCRTIREFCGVGT